MLLWTFFTRIYVKCLIFHENHNLWQRKKVCVRDIMPVNRKGFIGRHVRAGWVEATQVRPVWECKVRPVPPAQWQPGAVCLWASNLNQMQLRVTKLACRHSIPCPPNLLQTHHQSWITKWREMLEPNTDDIPPRQMLMGRDQNDPQKGFLCKDWSKSTGKSDFH